MIAPNSDISFASFNVIIYNLFGIHLKIDVSELHLMYPAYDRPKASPILESHIGLDRSVFAATNCPVSSLIHIPNPITFKELENAASTLH